MADNLLRQYFPMLPTRMELRDRIEKSPELRAIFYSWKPERQEEFLDFCTGERGLKMNLLQKYYFIPLDIFRKNIHNKGIRTKLDAWLVFLTSDEPERICELIGTYPEFQQLYADIYELCRNVEDIMGLFSKELLELDRNTVQYMIDEMQEEIDSSKKTIAEKEHQLVEKDQLLTEQGQQLAEKDQKLAEQDTLLHHQEMEKQLYGQLSRDGRLEDLGRAVTDSNYRKQLLEEYRLHL